MSKSPPQPRRLPLGVIGMSHGHVENVLAHAAGGRDVEVVGVWEPDRGLFARMAAKYGLPDDLWFSSLDEMLDRTNPTAASVMTAIDAHPAAVEACARRGAHVLLEKPLAINAGDAAQIAALAARGNVHVLTNYETSWYPSVRTAAAWLAAGRIGRLRRMVFRHGHRGPRAIGCGPEFVAWLTDSGRGGGALLDFGCYGAILATWLMGGLAPNRVTATRATLRPQEHGTVEDDATITLAYAGVTAVIQASWNWPYDCKEMDLFGEDGSLNAGRGNELTIRRPGEPPRRVTCDPMPPELANEWAWLSHFLTKGGEVDPLASLAHNLTAMEILDAAASAEDRERG